MSLRTARSGFTLIELLLVVAMLATLSTITLVALNPAGRYREARNTTRWSDVLAVLEAVKRYQADNDADLPTTAVAIDADPSSVQIIGETVIDCTCGTQTVKAAPCGISGLDTDLQPYLATIPFDPTAGSAADTRYYVNADTYGSITVGACAAEENVQGEMPVIEVTR